MKRIKEGVIVTKRESDKNEALENVSKAIADTILAMPVGSQSSIRILAGEFPVSEEDMFEIQDRVMKALKGKCKLDYSEYDNKVVGLPYNLVFTKK